MRKWLAVEGTPYPQGVSISKNKKGLNFSLYSKHGSRVQLLIYGEDTFKPMLTYEFNPRINRTHHIWHCTLPFKKLEGAKYYAYRVFGPDSKMGFHTFDPHKLLLDPFAKNVHFPKEFSRLAAERAGRNDGKAPLGVLPPFEEEEKHEVTHVFHDYDLVIYEMHVKQFTANPNSGVPQSHQGTYQGVIDKIPYLVELGITAVELMPIHQWDPQEGSAWGYMTLNFFTPHLQYASDQKTINGHIIEFRRMVEALHEANISVILDVVYNHTTESDHTGPIYSHKGVDNSTYYLMRYNGYELIYSNHSGTGNTVFSANMQSRRMILESLRFWVSEMGVDGFRFDLGSIFALDDEGQYNSDFYSIIHQISHDPVLSDVYVIAEPWDATFDSGGYLLGKDFPGNRWMQWNDKTRKIFRDFIRSENDLVSELIRRIYGSNDLFPGPEDDQLISRRPSQSINYIASHDGLTLYDMVSFTRPDMQSWDCGHHGVKDVPSEVMNLRKKQVKNFITMLMLSNGTPMFRAGDEFLQTQFGQSNPYNVDDESVWMNWDRLNVYHDIFDYFKQIIAFRKDHPSIARGRFWQEDVAWFGPNGPVDDTVTSHTLAFYLRGTNPEFKLEDEDIYVMINSFWEPIEFTIMEPGEWEQRFDTSQQDQVQRKLDSDSIVVQGRSIVILVGKGEV